MKTLSFFVFFLTNLKLFLLKTYSSPLIIPTVISIKVESWKKNWQKILFCLFFFWSKIKFSWTLKVFIDFLHISLHFFKEKNSFFMTFGSNVSTWKTSLTSQKRQKCDFRHKFVSVKNHQEFLQVEILPLPKVFSKTSKKTGKKRKKRRNLDVFTFLKWFY